MRQVLGLDPWDVQEQIARLLHEPPYRVLVRASYSVGKTWLCGALASYWYDTYNPSCVLTTAPRRDDVERLLWREIRLQRGNARLGGFPGPNVCMLFDNPNHYAEGFTAAKAESFRGRHQERMLWLIDEATGVPPIFWDGFNSQFQPSGQHAAVAIYNPTDTASEVYQLEKTGNWHVVKMAAIDHPNVREELAGRSAPYPAAVTLAQVNQWIEKDCTPILAEDATETDLEWPPGSGRWFHPEPRAEAGVLGRWPSRGVRTIWSEALWELLLRTRHELNDAWPVQIGCDVARFGDDYTSIHVRQGLCSLHHESHNGWDTKKTGRRLRELCNQFHGPHEERQVPVLVDATGGLGGGVVDHADGYNFIGVNSSEAALDEERFRNIRSELWFATAGLAKQGVIDISRALAGCKNLERDLGHQLMAVKYDSDLANRLVVEDKDETKKVLKRSPDDADAFNLAYYPHQPLTERVAGHIT